MKRPWGLLILTLVLAVIVVAGCASKTVLKEEALTQKEAASASAETMPAVPEKSALKEADEAKKSAKREQTEQEAAAKAQIQEETVAKEKAAEKATVKAAAERVAAEAATKTTAVKLADIHFDFDAFSLGDDARETLKKHAEWLDSNKDVMVVVEGHCDERGTAEYNLALGERRANAAAKFLINMGVDAKRIKTISYGEELPLDPGHNEAAWAKNRRAHFAVSGIK